MTLTINGRIPSKKNSKQIIRMGNRPMLISSKDYIKWEGGAAFELGVQASKFGINLPIIQATVTIEIMFPDLRASDLSNKAESIMDALVRGGVLLDDSWKVVNRLELIAMGSDKDRAGARVSIKLP
jgi:Holliday junction resolvase RusA-like endonuclease